MRMYDIIRKKRDGLELSKEEIEYFIQNYTKGDVPDYQASALLMAIYLNKMTKEETSQLTLAMANSGVVLDLSDIKGIKVDKHSTGGVGDKTSLILGAMVAACGVPVAKMSGRGLGHTGGTIDKLESIDGFNTTRKKQDFINQVNNIGFVIAGQTENLAPADKLLYALRDSIATIENVSLIASSIMSKKIASGADAIVLDVKVGEGAFMKNLEDAKELAKAMVDIGNSLNKKTVAIISDMNEPLGFAVGNSLEVIEAIETLKDNGPEDLMELCLTLGSHMILLSQKASNIEEARTMLKNSIKNGSALEKFKEFVENQEGNIDYINNTELFPKAKYIVDLKSNSEGYVNNVIANEVGIASMLLGAGRETKESSIDLSVGIVLRKKVGDEVKEGDVLATIYSNDETKTNLCREKLLSSIIINKETPKSKKLIYEVID